MVLECCEEARVAPSRTIVVGDTRYDMEMAAAAGAWAIGVGWGYHNEAELIAAGASIVIDSFDDLEGAVEALAGRESLTGAPA
jgi:phosphoglycolate phosphatase